tara:strand:+ start:57 stop:638 length:582 start_codon:yes stop_codon:yes gene_type:complete
MISQNIKIIDFKILYLILDEIKSYLPFAVSYHENEIQLIKNKDFKNENSIIVVNKNFNLNNLKIDDREIFIVNCYPVQINKLVSDLNISLIKQRYNYQAKIQIKDYTLDINSRNIFQKEKKLQLTEREIDVILFLKEKKIPQKVSQLQEAVWRYSQDLETHTVETHIYRLRKKMNQIFGDQNFIKSNQDGYSI